MRTEPIDPLTLEDRGAIRRMLARRLHVLETSPEKLRIPLQGGEGLAARYEIALTALEEKYELLVVAHGAKAVALDEIRQRVAGGRW